jgi:hyperosmotically inducible protein
MNAVKTRQASNRRGKEAQLRSPTRVSVFMLLLVLAIAGISSQPSYAGPPTGQQSPAPDNTKANAQGNGAVTADQQKESSSDRDLARRIRRAFIKDKSLSTYAHNVKIIAQGGMVTLKGPVRSEEEKQAVEAKAKAVAGDDKVSSALEVKPKT